MNKRSISIWPFQLVAIFLLSIMLYLPSLGGGSIWDDDDLISGAAFGGNSMLSAFTKPFLGHYFRPLTSASFVIDSSFAKATPFFYHQTNMLLHALTAVLIACLALCVTQIRTAGVLAGVLFATQPLQVGAAAWIGGRTDVLSAFFLAAFMVTLVQYHRTQGRAWLVASILSFFLAALSKEQALFMLPAVPFSVFAFGSRKWKDVWRLCIPFGVVVLVYIGLWIIDAPAPYGAKSGLFNTVTLALRTAAHYGLALLTPNNPSLLTFTLENYRGILWISIGALLVAGLAYFLKSSWKDQRPLVWVAVCGLLVYMPVSNFPPVPSFVVGPYRFAEAGAAAACVMGIVFAAAIANKRFVLAGAFVANLVAGVVVSWWGIHQWNQPLSLFKTVAGIDHHFMVGVGNYSHALELEGRIDEELRWTNDVLTWMFGTDKWIDLLNTKKLDAFTPDVTERLKTNGGIADHKALGWFISCYASGLAHQKRTSEAIVVEREAMMVGPKDARIHFAYGQLMLSSDRPEAIKHWEIALKLTPKYSACAAALAHERVVDHRYADAVALLEPIMSDIGWDASAWIDLADAKIGLHDLAGAATALTHAETDAIYKKKDDVESRKKRIRELSKGGKP